MPRFSAPRRRLRALLTMLPLLFALLPPRAVCATDISVTDDTGRTVRLQEPAKRVISLYGAFNEILLSLGLGERIIARTAADAVPSSSFTTAIKSVARMSSPASAAAMASVGRGP